jgi:hypothetical protein
MPAQRMRLADAAAADPPAATLSPLSAAQRCAADTLTLVFGFVELEEFVPAARTCKAWLVAAAKEKPRGLIRSFEQARQLRAFCESSSPFKKHISRIDCSDKFSIDLTRLTQLSQLTELTALNVQLNVADVTRLMDAEGGGALAALQAAFPPKLRELTMSMPTAQTAVCQLLLDALPAMAGLEQLSLDDAAADQTAEALSLEPLLQLPRLTRLKWLIGYLAVPQLLIIKQIATLQFFDPGTDDWLPDQLSAFCRPPHRLQRLEEIKMHNTDIDAAMMADLVCLPALTSLEPHFLASSAFALLPRFPQLQRLSASLGSGDDALDQQAERSALLVSALTACPALIDLTLNRGECSESFCGQLMQAVPRLRALRFETCYLPSLRFLRHVPNLKRLTLLDCRSVRVGHVIGIGAFASQLESLSLDNCAGLRLDKAEVQLLTPPGALGLPHLREFYYYPPEPGSDSDASEDGEADVLSPD